MNLNLLNKNALVCGASAGIGMASAIELALLGANVTLLSRNELKLQQALQTLDVSKNQRHKYIVADFSEPQNLQYIVKQNIESTGLVYHILVNNTGGPAPGTAIDGTLQQYEAAFNSMLLSGQMLVQLLVLGMKDNNYGRIINITSTSIKEPILNLGVSTTVRWAVAGWSKMLANELGVFGITVNNVLPGSTNTERLQNIIRNKAAIKKCSTQSIISQMQADVPLGRFATAEEIGAVVAFLASPAAAYINGANIVVDGGRTKSL